MTKDRLGKIFLLIWLPLVVVVISVQMASHLLTFPLPQNQQAVAAGFLKLRKDTNKDWFLVHLVDSSCSCANSLIQQLLGSRKNPDEERHLVLIGSDHRVNRLQKLGFQITSLSNQDVFQRFHLEVAPVLAIFYRSELRYLGGYYKNNYQWDSEHFQILSQLKNSRPIAEAYPIYGCAVSEKLKKALDPTGINAFVDAIEN